VLDNHPSIYFNYMRGFDAKIVTAADRNLNMEVFAQCLKVVQAIGAVGLDIEVEDQENEADHESWQGAQNNH
jgi:hypothetical protein